MKLPSFHPDRVWAAGAAAIALGVVCIAVMRGSFVAAGADAYGYMSQAELWRRGLPRLFQAIAAQAPWPNADWTFAPFGYRPGAERGWIVATYPPGLPLVMALGLAVAGDVGRAAVVPLSAGAVVLLTFSLGRKVGGGAVGWSAAILTATGPAFLLQALQPMSDVPVTAWWLLALWCALRNAPLGAGAASALAILTRPNLLPLAMAPLLLSSIRSQHRGRTVSRFAAGALPALVAIAWLNRTLYGSAFASGYGRLDELYAAANVVTNVRRYGGWLFETLGPLPLLSVLAFALVRDRQTRAAAAAFGAFAVLALACYLPYAVFDEWMYVRFLLPAVPLLWIVTMVTLAHLVRRFAPRLGVIALIAVASGSAWWSARQATRLGVFRAAHLDRRYAVTGRLATSFPERSVLFAVQQSGSLRHYSHPTTLRWDLLAAADFDRAADWLHERGYTPFLVIESWEEPDFRRKFAGVSRFGALDWPPEYEVRALVRVRVYDLRDRARFRAGADVRTKIVWDEP